MPDPQTKLPDHVIRPDQKVARRIFRHVIEGPLADPPQVHASLMDVLELLDGEGVNTAIFEGEGYSMIVNWSRNPTKEGS